MPSEVSPAWSLDGIYEPSAVQQLPDGRFLVVEDEKRQPFSVFTVGADGRVQSQALTPSLFQVSSSAWKLDDLEGLTMDQSGFLYAITSHSRDEDGNEKKSREKLIRFRVDGRHVVMPQVVSDLKRALTTRYPVLDAAAAVRDVKDSGGLNIEALEVDPHNGQLLIAFRSPLVDGKAIVACLENTADVFHSGAKARFPPTLEELNLGAWHSRFVLRAFAGRVLADRGPSVQGRQRIRALALERRRGRGSTCADSTRGGFDACRGNERCADQRRRACHRGLR